MITASEGLYLVPPVYRIGQEVTYAAQDEPPRTGRIVDVFPGAVTGHPVYVINTPHLGETGFYADELRPA